MICCFAWTTVSFGFYWFLFFSCESAKKEKIKTAMNEIVGIIILFFAPLEICFFMSIF